VAEQRCREKKAKKKSAVQKGENAYKKANVVLKGGIKNAVPAEEQGAIKRGEKER